MRREYDGVLVFLIGAVFVIWMTEEVRVKIKYVIMLMVAGIICVLSFVKVTPDYDPECHFERQPEQYLDIADGPIIERLGDRLNITYKNHVQETRWWSTRDELDPVDFAFVNDAVVPTGVKVHSEFHPMQGQLLGRDAKPVFTLDKSPATISRYFATPNGPAIFWYEGGPDAANRHTHGHISFLVESSDLGSRFAIGKTYDIDDNVPSFGHLFDSDVSYDGKETFGILTRRFSGDYAFTRMSLDGAFSKPIELNGKDIGYQPASYVPIIGENFAAVALSYSWEKHMQTVLISKLLCKK